MFLCRSGDLTTTFDVSMMVAEQEQNRYMRLGACDENKVVTMETGFIVMKMMLVQSVCWRLLRGKTWWSVSMAAILSFIVTAWRCVSVTTKLCMCLCVCVYSVCVRACVRACVRTCVCVNCEGTESVVWCTTNFL